MDDFWSACVSHLRRNFDENLFDAFIAPARAARGGNGRLLVSAPDEAAARWLEQNVKESLTSFARAHLGEEVSLSFHADETTATPATAAAPRRAKPNEANLRADFTFDNFLTGRANETAYVAARAISTGNADQLSPLLFLFGGTGLGKTHLAQAVGNHYLSLHPARRGRYVMARDFMADVVNASRLNQHEKFKRRYDSLDLLIVDDIQYIGGDKERTQEEFFFLFNRLHDQNKIIIITSDRAPMHIRDLPERLTSRLRCGIPGHLAPPETELREAILRQKAKQLGAPLEDHVIRFIAEKIKSNVRELEGALRRVLASSRFLGKPPSLDICREALADLVDFTRESVNVDIIKKKTAEFFRLRVSDLSSTRRHRSVALPRHIAMYLCRHMTNLSLPEIGAQFGDREHSTVLHSCRKIETMLKTNSQIQEDVRILEMLIKS